MKASLLVVVALSTTSLSQSVQSATGNVDVYGNISIGITSAYGITFTGTLGDGIVGGEDPGFGYDLSGWYGKSYALSFILDSDPANANLSGISPSPQIPGNIYRWWNFDPALGYRVSLMINGVPVLSGSDFYKNEVIAGDNQWVPGDITALPPGVEGDRAYDGLLLKTGHLVGCSDGPCDWSNPSQVREELWIGVGYVWSELTVIGETLPNLNDIAPVFADALYSRISIVAGRRNLDGSVH